jgi:hypothetical protein
MEDNIRRYEFVDRTERFSIYHVEYSIFIEARHGSHVDHGYGKSCVQVFSESVRQVERAVVCAR